jgi:hypothetical protein
MFPCAAILGLFEILDRFRQKERHWGQEYRVIDDIYSPAFHATITRTGYLDARHFPWKRLLKQQLSWKRIWQRICERMAIPVVHRDNSAQIRIEEKRPARNTRRDTEIPLLSIPILCNKRAIFSKSPSFVSVTARKKTPKPETIVYCGISPRRSASIGDDRRKPKQVDREKKYEKADLGKILHPLRR